jgi:hypothetical protein
MLKLFPFAEGVHLRWRPSLPFPTRRSPRPFESYIIMS